MSKIIAEISNPVWWFSVVIAGISINILSSYLRGALDGFFSKSSSWWRNRSLARKKVWEKRVDKIAFSVEEKNYVVVEEFRSRLDTVLICSLLSIFLQLLFFALIIIKQEGLHTDVVNFMFILIMLFMFFVLVFCFTIIPLYFSFSNTKKAIEEARRRSANLLKHKMEQE
jgi:hypothetical protein